MSKRKLDPPGQGGNKFPHTEMSDVVCAVKGCNRLIKKNVVVRKTGTKPLVCYPCHISIWIARQSKGARHMHA